MENERRQSLTTRRYGRRSILRAGLGGAAAVAAGGPGAGPHLLDAVDAAALREAA